MLNKILIESAEILEDMADVADIRGRASEKRIGAVYIDAEHGDRMRHLSNSLRQILKEIWCKNIEFGSYDCYESTEYGFDVDSCLVGEINRLNADGIKTIGCCCGHGKQQGYIQVAPDFVDKMFELGYEQLSVDANGNGQWCFKPQTRWW